MAQEHVLQAEVVVVGGGMTGVCAAVAAARHGRQVVLVQDRPVLGGNASSEIRMHICGADCSGARPGWRESGLLEEIRLTDAVRNPQRSASLHDLLLWELVTAEPNITLLLNTSCVGVRMAGPDRIAEVEAIRPSTEDAFRIQAALFIDSSGDGLLGAQAGAEYRLGREAAAEYGESLAPAQADRRTLGSSVLFIARDMGRPMPFVAPAWARKFPREEDLPHRGHKTWHYGYWWIEWGGQLDTIKDNERIRDELLRIALGVWDHIKNHGDHGADNWALQWLGFVPGKRESRRFLGDHVLCQADLESARVFPDAVAYGGWPIDLHPVAGIDSPDPPAQSVRLKDVYGIPLRSLYSRNITNLFVAGRNHSATHVAFGSTRVMGTCAVMGQAVGTAAALCLERGCRPRELAHDRPAELQQRLLADDVTIPGVVNADPADRARQATVRASSHAPGADPCWVIQGPTRPIGDRYNGWQSDPGRPLPQWLELTWARPVELSRVQVIFDTGFHRCLTLTHEEGYASRMVRGPQPETVRDYRLLVRTGGGAWTPVAEVAGNFLRRRQHRFAPRPVDALRLEVTATHGDPRARVFEVRAM